MWEEYSFATSVDDALQLLAAHGGKAQIIAGGTDLVLQSQRRQCPATVLVDITRIPELDQIVEHDDYVLIGALATHAQIAASPVVQTRAAVLSAACAHVGGPQTRNAGTLVGNVVNAQPAADGAVALFALDAEVEIATPQGRRWEPVTTIYRGVGACAIDACHEMVTAIRFRPLTDTCGCGYERLARRKALTLPTLVVATVLRMDRDSIASARIAVGPVAPTPFRAADAEAFLAGRRPTEDNFARAGQLVAAKAQPRDSLIRGSREYRTEMAAVLVRRALAQAFAQCGKR